MWKKHQALWDLTQGERLRYGVAILALGLSIGLGALVPLASRTAIDRAARGETEGLVGFAAVIVLLSVAGGGLFYAKGRLAAIASERMARRLRDRLFDQLQRVPQAYHDRADSGDLVQRCSSDVETVRLFLAAQVVEIGRGALLLLAITPILFWLDAALAWVAIALLPFILGFAVLFFGRIQTVFRAADEAEGAMTAALQENLSGARVVRAFGREEFEVEKFAGHNAAFRDRSLRLIRLLGLYWATSDLMCFAQTGLVLFASGARVLAGTLSVGTMFAFVSYAAMIVWPLRQLGRILADLGKASVAMARIEEVLAVRIEAESEVATDAHPADRSTGAGQLDVEGLSFAYDPGRDVLHDVSLAVAPGETVAIVGPPGSGKTTLVALLVRLYEHERGSIRLDGCEVRTIPRQVLRGRVGLVLQETFLYARSIRDNLRYGRPGAGESEIIDSARTACLHEAIESFAAGYDTLVGERGVTLSGGQRQRMAIARAFLKDPDVLVLDDSLSAVDSRTEQSIREALRARRNRRTTLVIAHRLSTMAHADRVVVMDGGRVVEAGPPADLAQRDGPFRKLVLLQGAIADEVTEARHA